MIVPLHDLPRVLRAVRLLGARGRRLQQVLTVLAVHTAVRKRDVAKKAPPQRRARDDEAVDRKYGIRRMDSLPEKDFRKMFRVSKARFDFLLDLVTPHIMRDELKGANSCAQPIKPKTRLAATLRWLAGGSYHDICELYSVSRSSFYGQNGIIWPTIRALDEELDLSYPINDAEKLEEISALFERDSRGLLKGCVGAVDGLLIRTRCPYKREHRYGKLFRNRKSAFGIIALGIADPNGKFLSFCADWSGSTHDATAWATSDLKSWMDEGRLCKDVSRCLLHYFPQPCHVLTSLRLPSSPSSRSTFLLETRPFLSATNSWVLGAGVDASTASERRRTRSTFTCLRHACTSSALSACSCGGGGFFGDVSNSTTLGGPLSPACAQSCTTSASTTWSKRPGTTTET